jgi:OOP family OmpA-OmpF porin
MKKQFNTLAITLMLGLLLLVATHTQAFEIITKQDIIEKKFTKEDFVKTADNFIILYDASGSMAKPYADTGAAKIEAQNKILRQQNEVLPDLGYKAGLYTFTPFKSYYEMQPYQRKTFASALDSLPTVKTAGTYVEQPTPLGHGIQKLDPILAKLSGRTAVIVFTDGSYTLKTGGKRFYPLDAVRSIAEKHNVCFYFVSSATTAKEEKLLEDLAAVNACSQVIPFDVLYDRPVVGTGAILYTAKSTVDVQTFTESRIAGASVNDIRFDFDSADIRADNRTELNNVGKFMQENPEAYVILAGYCDSTGTQEYNLHLSKRRALSVADYLGRNFNIESNRIMMYWYGMTNPKAGNDTSDGRARNRRVEIAVGGLS